MTAFEPNNTIIPNSFYFLDFFSRIVEISECYAVTFSLFNNVYNIQDLTGIYIKTIKSILFCRLVGLLSLNH